MLDDTEFRDTDPSLASAPKTGGRAFWSALIQTLIVLLLALGAIAIAASMGLALVAARPDSPDGMELVGP